MLEEVQLQSPLLYPEMCDLTLPCKWIEAE